MIRLLIALVPAGCAALPSAPDTFVARPVVASVPDRMTGSARYQGFGDADAAVSAAVPATMTGQARYQEFSANSARALGGDATVRARPGANGEIEPTNAEAR